MNSEALPCQHSQKNINGNLICLLPENIFTSWYYQKLKNQDVKDGKNTVLESVQKVNKLQTEKKIPSIDWEVDNWTSLINILDLSFLREPVCIKEYYVDQIQEVFED